MRWSTYRSPRDGQDRVGQLYEDAVHGVAEPHSLVEALRGGQDVLQLAAETALTSPEGVIPAAEVVLRAPVPVPPSIRDFMAFEEHVVTSMKAIGRSVDPVWYEIPVFYFTNPAAVLRALRADPGRPWLGRVRLRARGGRGHRQGGIQHLGAGRCGRHRRLYLCWRTGAHATCRSTRWPKASDPRRSIPDVH
jgi:hypothetical protein